jgi:integral membrane protein
MDTKIKQLQSAGYIEGISYLVLLFIAMPLKYIFHIFIAVKIVGMIHGLLFIIFCLLFVRIISCNHLSPIVKFLIFVSSLVPFGMIFSKKLFLKK